jgi:hypothetical protein
MTPSSLLVALRAHCAGRAAPVAGEGTRLMFLACPESLASAALLAALPAAYVLQTLAQPPQHLDATWRETFELGVLALEADGVGVGQVVGDRVELGFLRDHSRGGDV